MGDEAGLAWSTIGGVLEAKASGRWTADCAAALDAAATRMLADVSSGTPLRIEMSDVSTFDTYGAAILARLRQECRARESRCEVFGLAARFTGLATRIDAVGIKHPPPASRIRWTSTVEGVEAGLNKIMKDAVALLSLFGAVCHALVTVLRQPRAFRLTSTVHQIDRACLQAVPIILLITTLIGGIIAQQGFFHFRKFGADQYVVDMVGILVLREIAVLLVAIMVAGRSGSSYTAELGSMKMREEIDALQTMGLDPVAVLILPRILALVVALPVLTFLGMMSALYGGGFVAWVYGDMNPHVFIERLREAISISHFKVGMVKAPFMALVVGTVACAEGLKVRGSAESLGLRTTASVVKSIFLVIVLDGLFAIYFASIGM